MIHRTSPEDSVPCDCWGGHAYVCYSVLVSSMIPGWHRNCASRAAGPACVHGPYQTLIFKARRRERGFPAADDCAHETAVAPDLRPLMLESQSLETLIPVAPGTATWLEAEVALLPARPAFRTFARTRGPQRQPQPCNLSENQSLAGEPSRFRGKRQEPLRKNIS